MAFPGSESEIYEKIMSCKHSNLLSFWVNDVSKYHELKRAVDSKS